MAPDKLPSQILSLSLGYLLETTKTKVCTMAEAGTRWREKHLVVISRSCLDVEGSSSLEYHLKSSISRLKELGYCVVAISHNVAKLSDQVHRMDLQIK